MRVTQQQRLAAVAMFAPLLATVHTARQAETNPRERAALGAFLGLLEELLAGPYAFEAVLVMEAGVERGTAPPMPMRCQRVGCSLVFVPPSESVTACPGCQRGETGAGAENAAAGE
ncbi:MAG TPA: hypothetical protein PK625_00935 [Spirochaetales bacterium]|nr:hypothetical protein [Spirochaetales bacterium]